MNSSPNKVSMASRFSAYRLVLYKDWYATAGMYHAA